MSKIIRIEEFGITAKISYDNGEIVYFWPSGRHKISADNDTIESTNDKLSSEDFYHKQSYKFSDQEVTYGTENAVEYVEYLIANELFFFDGIVQKVSIEDQPIEVNGEVRVTRDEWLSSDLWRILSELKKISKTLLKIYQ